MSSAIVPMPVTIEQVAAVIRNMTRKDRQRLLELVPELQEIAYAPAAVQGDASIEQLREEIAVALGTQPLAADDLFVEGLTVGEYLDLSDSERADIWNRWLPNETESWKEVDVHANALLAR
jgi:hypothetical protein